MTLARKLALHIVALVAALLLIGGASVWGLMGMSKHFDVAEDRYDQLRAVYEVGHHAASARLLINAQIKDADAVSAEIGTALRLAEELQKREPSPAIASIIDRLNRVIDQSHRAEPRVDQINTALGEVATLAADMRTRIIDNRRAASDRLTATIWALAGLLAATLIAAIVIGVRQYRSVMSPLRRLDAAVRRAAAADFDHHVPTEGDREFAQLAVQFNRMADHLDTLYRDLEEQVNARSQQLVRSERLASVGYLAAGLAHEINNPLGIICGYAESALAMLNRDATSPAAMERSAKALKIVCEEAFRCRDITAQLLTLSRPENEQTRRPTPIGPIVQRVGELLGGLPQFADRSVNVELDETAPLIAEANEAQITQVLINVVSNALEAVEPRTGRVDVQVRRQAGWITIQVTDNGRGLSAEALPRVFEPFFTDKPQRDQRGTGLGLSVAHAIAMQHRGRLHARSAGVGAGSVFTFELPAAGAPLESAASSVGTVTAS